jgi:hypothetical protein
MRDFARAQPLTTERGRGRKTLIPVLTAAVLLAGCAGDGAFKQSVAPPAPTQIEAGSTFNLLVPLAFPEGSDALYFQDSQLVSPAGILRDLPYCKLTPASATAPRLIAPATFAARSVVYDDKRSTSTGQVVSVTRIALVANPTQPYTLNCQWPQGGPSRSFLTSEEIQGAIGAHFSMALQR